MSLAFAFRSRELLLQLSPANQMNIMRAKQFEFQTNYRHGLVNDFIMHTCGMFMGFFLEQMWPGFEIFPEKTLKFFLKKTLKIFLEKGKTVNCLLTNFQIFSVSVLFICEPIGSLLSAVVTGEMHSNLLRYIT